MEIELLKYTFKHRRENSKEIFKGFGLSHLQDVTGIYVHTGNQARKATTTISQAIGEAASLFRVLIRSINDGSPLGDIYFDEYYSDFMLCMQVPAEWKKAEVFTGDIHSFKVQISKKSIWVAAYNLLGELIADSISQIDQNYKLCACVMAVIARDSITDMDFSATMREYIEANSMLTFVTACEDIYQKNKATKFDINCLDLSGLEQTYRKKLSDNLDIAHEATRKQIAITPQAKAIIRFSDSDFAPELREHIPHLSAEFALEPRFASLCSAIASGDIRCCLMHGPAGTGKTMSCKLICQEIRLPILETINCTENLDEFVLGKYIPADDRIIFKESYVTKAIREGGAVVFEEINFAKPQYLAFLNSLLDDNGFVRLDNGDIVRRHKNFRFFATMNIGYSGTKELNQALYNRFNAIVEIPSLSDTAIKRMLTARVPECATMVDTILNVYHKIKQKIKVEELDAVISPRTLENWARLAKYEGYIDAAEKTIVPIAKTDQELASTIRSLVTVYTWE